MGDVLIAVLFVVLVNGACIVSFDRAQGAIRDLWALKRLSPTAIFSLYASLIHR